MRLATLTARYSWFGNDLYIRDTIAETARQALLHKVWRTGRRVAYSPHGLFMIYFPRSYGRPSVWHIDRDVALACVPEMLYHTFHAACQRPGIIYDLRKPLAPPKAPKPPSRKQILNDFIQEQQYEAFLNGVTVDVPRLTESFTKFWSTYLKKPKKGRSP